MIGKIKMINILKNKNNKEEKLKIFQSQMFLKMKIMKIKFSQPKKRKKNLNKLKRDNKKIQELK